MASEEFIKKSYLIKVLENLYAKFGESKHIRTKTMIKAIEKMPAAADAVEVVRCKDCRHGDRSNWIFGKLPIHCNLFCTGVHEEGFCYCGERRAEHENN